MRWTQGNSPKKETPSTPHKQSQTAKGKAGTRHHVQPAPRFPRMTRGRPTSAQNTEVGGDRHAASCTATLSSPSDCRTGQTPGRPRCRQGSRRRHLGPLPPDSRRAALTGTRRCAVLGRPNGRPRASPGAIFHGRGTGPGLRVCQDGAVAGSLLRLKRRVLMPSIQWSFKP